MAKRAPAPPDDEAMRRSKRADSYRAAAKTLGLSLEKLARRLDLSLSTSNRYASGESPVPQRVSDLIERWIAEAKIPKKKRGA